MSAAATPLESSGPSPTGLESGAPPYRPTYSAGELARLMVREIWLMILVFGIIMLIGISVAFLMPKTYSVNANLLMQLGADYVYRPTSGDEARGAVATIDEVVQSESAILKSDELKRRVIRQLGYKILLPDAPGLWQPKSEAEKTAADSAAMRSMSSLKIDTAPTSNVVNLSYKHAVAETAALTLNTLIDQYRIYRREVHSDVSGPALQAQRDDFDSRLKVADLAYQDFLTRNGVADYLTTRQTYTKVYDTAVAEKFTLEETLAQDLARLSVINDKLKTLSPEMSLQRDLDLSVPTRITALRQQRQELLARYQPDSPPVQDLNAQIAALQSMLGTGSAIGEKEHKLGANPLYGDILKQKLDLEAELAALRGRQGQLNEQLGQLTQKLQYLASLEGEYNNLSTVRETLATNLKTYTARLQEDEARRAMSKNSDEVVRVVERARPPEKATSLRQPILAASLVLALSTALLAGLLRIFTRKGFSNARMASQALDLPVLAQAGTRAPGPDLSIHNPSGAEI